MKVITFLNEKGGVGKTTLASTTAFGLAILGYKVLMVDTDAQGHAGVLMQQKKWGGFFRLVGQDAEWHEVTVTIDKAIWLPDGCETNGSLILLPSNKETRAVPIVAEGDDEVLRIRLQEIADDVDYVIIDTTPAPSMLHQIIYFATDYVVIPTLTSNLSLDGVAETVQSWANINRKRQKYGLPNAQLLGVQPNKVKIYKDGYTKNSEEYYDLLCEHFPNGTVWARIGAREAWEKASAQCVSIFKHNDEKAIAEAWIMVKAVERGTQ